MKNVLAAALGFATRLPVAWLGEPDADSFIRARSLLPLVGALIGSMGALVGLISFRLVGDADVAAWLAFATTIAVTGAMHEDGLADVCDGIGGGSERERVLAIMRDSRLGSFGVLGLVLSTALRVRLFAFLLEHEASGVALSTFVASHVIARSAAVLAMDRYPYARTSDASANGSAVDRPFEPKERATYAIPAVVFAALASRDPTLPVLLCTAALAVAVTMGSLFRRWISGVTGDCLGAIEQLTEISVLFVACAGAMR